MLCRHSFPQQRLSSFPGWNVCNFSLLKGRYRNSPSKWTYLYMFRQTDRQTALLAQSASRVASKLVWECQQTLCLQTSRTKSHCSGPWSWCDWGCEVAGALPTDGSSSPYISCEPAVSVSTTGRLGSKHSENLISTQDVRQPRFFSERELLHIHGEQHRLIRKITSCCSPRHHLNMKHL